MKVFLTIVVTLIVFNARAQEWNFLGKTGTSKLPYEYNFSLDHNDDTSSINMIRRQGTKSNIRIVISDRTGDSTIYSQLTIVNRSRDSIVHFVNDLEIERHIELEPGSYSFTIESMTHDPISGHFEINDDESILIEAYLGMNAETEIYEIHSRRTLLETELIEIINCVKEHGISTLNLCSREKKYRVMVQI